MASVIVRLGMIGWKWWKTAGLSKAIDGELHERRVSFHGLDVNMGSQHADSDFTPEEEESAFSTNRTMCACQLAISVAQLAVSAARFKDAPLRDTVNIVACGVSLPLVAAGLFALSHPEAEYAVLTMHFYQLFFVLRSALVVFDYSFLVDTRKRFGTTQREIIMAGIVLAAVLTLQLLNSLLVLAVIRIMRKKRNEAEAREAAERKGGDAATEATPLLPGDGYTPPQPVA